MIHIQEKQELYAYMERLINLPFQGENIGSSFNPGRCLRAEIIRAFSPKNK